VKKLTSGVLTGALAAALAASMTQAPASAAPPEDGEARGASAAHRKDNLPGPLTQRQNQLRAAAVEAVAEGRAQARRQDGGGSVVVLGTSGGRKKAVELFDNDKQANVLSIMSEFGEQTDPAYGGDAGPAHNQIPQPDRSVDNTSTWEPDYDKAYYEELFNGSGESMKNFYLEASDGEYTVENTVEGWTTVPYNDAYYGSNIGDREFAGGGVWEFISDTADSWYADKLAELGSVKAVDEYLAQFDNWDRYDQDGDGNFNEPDGYIDHFQAIHSGEGEEAGASPDAIWSHRWYVNATDFGDTGPTVDRQQVLYGGAQIGDSKYWLGDYTVEPENGGLGVFVHEYAHDLGIPDLYDTAGGDNGVGFWSVMSAGSWLGHGEAAGDGIGTTPGGFGPDERAQMGWLDYQTVEAGESETHTLAPSNQAGAGTEAVKVVLPNKETKDVYNTPAAGTHSWWSTRGDGLNVTMTYDVPAAQSVNVSAQVWHEIEADYDYLYGEYSTDGGTTWTRIGEGLDGSSNDAWIGRDWGYSPNGAATKFRFRYQTDGGVNEAGAFLDEITVTADGNVLNTEGAEGASTPWTVNGWERSTGTDINSNVQYYWLENRQHLGYDRTLKTGPYNFSAAYSRPNWVEFFSFQPGMLVWYADKSQPDNNTTQHPGYGQALPVDARPEPFTYPDGTKPGNRRQPYDATFGVNPIEPLCLHKEVLRGRKKVQVLEACQDDTAPIATFDDSDVDAYWSSANPLSSTKVAGIGVTAEVLRQEGDNLVVEVTNP